MGSCSLYPCVVSPSNSLFQPFDSSLACSTGHKMGFLFPCGELCVCFGWRTKPLRSFSARWHLPGPPQDIRGALITWDVEKEGFDLDLHTLKDELTYSYSSDICWEIVFKRASDSRWLAVSNPRQGINWAEFKNIFFFKLVDLTSSFSNRSLFFFFLTFVWLCQVFVVACGI